MDNLEIVERIDQARFQLDFIVSGLTARANQYHGLEWPEVEGLEHSLKDISGKMKALSEELDS